MALGYEASALVLIVLALLTSLYTVVCSVITNSMMHKEETVKNNCTSVSHWTTK